MSQGPPPSLLDYLDAPILVGDPDGRTVYVNPAFESSFGVDPEKIRGESLAALFEGGAREAILRAVADVCRGSGNAHFQLREGKQGYTAIASPISAAASRVGVIILLTKEQTPSERLISCGSGFAAPIDELTRCLSEIADDVGDRASASSRAAFADAAKAVDELRKRSDELVGMLANGKSLANG